MCWSLHGDSSCLESALFSGPGAAACNRHLVLVAPGKEGHAFTRDWNMGDADNTPPLTISAPWLEGRGVQGEV